MKKKEIKQALKDRKSIEDIKQTFKDMEDRRIWLEKQKIIYDWMNGNTFKSKKKH